MKTKVCNNCKLEKPLSEFHVRRENSPDGLQYSCKKCGHERTRSHRVAQKKKIDAIKMSRGCESGYCQWGGEFEPHQLAFDHIDPKTKSDGIHRMSNRKWETIQAEINKCQVLCHICHSDKTLTERRDR